MLAHARQKTGPRFGRIHRPHGANTRHRLITRNHPATYHVMSRTAGGARLFGSTEKEAFREIMRRMEDFTGVRILTYALMDNHFHLLLHVPDQAKFLARFQDSSTADGETKLLRHLATLYSPAFIAQLQREIRHLRQAGREKEIAALLARFQHRMCDLTAFVKELKERFTRWYNKHHGRRGTLWMGNFKSLLVQNGLALRTIAAYIDLNPLRAGYVNDPQDYRWSGYGEALGTTSPAARATRAARGICRIVEVPHTQWKKLAAPIYRCWLYEDGVSHTQADQKPPAPKNTRPSTSPSSSRQRGFTLQKMNQTKAELGEIDRARLLLTRVRYFTQGLALGNEKFTQTQLQNHHQNHHLHHQQSPHRKRQRNTQKLTPHLHTLRPRDRENPPQQNNPAP